MSRHWQDPRMTPDGYQDEQGTLWLFGPSTLSPHCIRCGEYLLPCTTANGIHPAIYGAGHIARRAADGFDQSAERADLQSLPR